MTENVREAALKLLLKTVREGGYSNFLYESAIFRNPEWDTRDRAFLKTLFFGVLRNLFLLDHIVQKRLKGDFTRLPEKIRFILRLGTYQIISMDKVPAKAAISESINLSKKYGHAGTAKLVTAVLNRISREKDEICNLMESETSNNIDDLSVRYSIPDHIISKCIDNYGYELAAKTFKAFNEIPPQNYRVADWGRLKSECEKLNIEIEKNLYTSNGVDLSGAEYKNIEKLKYDGLIASQDQSSIMAVELLTGLGGAGLELCCGRGNKSQLVGKVVENSRFHIAADISVKKLVELKRRNLPKTFPICFDAKEGFPFRCNFDWIFLDAPCTNLGTVRRHPEIKYRKSPAAILAAAEAQALFLKNAAKQLNRGGKLLYSVCSFEPEETFEVITPFLRNNGGFELIDIGRMRPDLADAGLISGGCLRIFPGQHGMDGFFAAMVQKTA